MRETAGNSAKTGDSQLLQSIIETAPDAIITANARGEILSFSPAAEKMFGYSRAEVIGENLSILMPEPHSADHDSYMKRYLETGEKHIIGIGREVWAKRKGGETFKAELAVGEVSSGEDVIFTGFIRDISERVDAQRKAARLQRSLDQMARTQMLGEMSSALAHEINQPLTAVSNFTRAAGRALAKPEIDREKVAGFVERAAEQVQRAGEIIKRMRRLIERGQADLEPDDINEIVREAIRSQRDIEEVPPQVVLDLATDLPPVLADRIQVQQVIINLVQNAQEAMIGYEDHDVHLATALSDTLGPIRLRAAHVDAGEVMITVSDTGPGFPEGMAEQLFEPFVTKKPNGLGVGLAVCRSIIHAHGGKIWAENGANGGSEFHFTLPVAETVAK